MTSQDLPPASTAGSRERRGTTTRAAALAGVVAGAAGIGAGEVAAAIAAPEASPFVAVGEAVVDHMPGVIRDGAIDLFGTADKPALFVGMGVILAGFAALAGVLELRRPPVGRVLVLLLAAVGVLAGLTQSNATLAHAFPALIVGVVGVFVLMLLIGMIEREISAESEVSTAVAGPSRRFFLTAAAIGAGAVVVGGIARRSLNAAARSVAARAGITLPTPADPAPPIPPNADLSNALGELTGSTPYVTDNADFYRIDTALQVPRVDPDAWQLRIHGRVENETTLTWADLLAMPMTERVVTLTCVSNDVGGNLIGNARWLGVPMAEILARAGVQDGADMLLSTSADGWTCGTPITAITDGRDALLAIGMNGEPLPLEHGFPVRQVIPGLYGYVSATKWVTDWEITTFAAAEAYWTTRGWDPKGPIKLSSRIDRPPQSSNHAAGEVIVAGTAWAQHTGIEAVEVRIDDGPWQQAELAAEHSVDTWRQWWFRWTAPSGTHVVTCRAVDRDGNFQEERYASPIPSGATGLHDRSFTIS